jgi:bacterioferritin-associated ferredoxin
MNEGAVIVCQCRRVSDRKVASCVSKGCSSLRDLCAQTGAGRDCGSCVGRLRQMLDTLSPAHPTEALRATA